MARISALDEIDSALRHALQTELRLVDEAIVLPSASRSVESGAFKNVLISLSGSENGLDPAVLSEKWFDGLSLIKLPTSAVEHLFQNRKQALKKLTDAIPSELADDVTIGPDLLGDEEGRDLKKWEAGFSSPSDYAGIFSSSHSQAPQNGLTGMHRNHQAYYLVCKAGGGISAATFDARLRAALKDGATLDEALSEEGSPGAPALRRVSVAAARNRARILAMAANALGLQVHVDTISDGRSSADSCAREAIVGASVVTNSLRRSDDGNYIYSSGCVDAQLSSGLATLSNPADGLTVFLTDEGGLRTNVKNDASSTLPFTTPRLLSSNQAASCCAKDVKNGHPDEEWITTRFGWRQKELKNMTNKNLVPLSFWGSYDTSSWIATYGRELGVSRLANVKLTPECVAVSATEPAKLRAVLKKL